MTVLLIICTRMSLFGANRPKGITKAELNYVRGELKNAPFGHSAEILNSRQVDEITRRLELCLDSDSATEHMNKWQQVNQAEVTQIEAQLAHDTAIHLSEAQKTHVKQVLQKYVDIDKYGGMFSL
jgi:hypothetical protein